MSSLKSLRIHLVFFLQICKLLAQFLKCPLESLDFAVQTCGLNVQPDFLHATRSADLKSQNDFIALGFLKLGLLAADFCGDLLKRCWLVHDDNYTDKPLNVNGLSLRIPLRN